MTPGNIAWACFIFWTAGIVSTVSLIIINNEQSHPALLFKIFRHFLIVFPGVCECVLITQWPRDIISNSRAQMHCYQNDTEYEYLYWYRQLRGGEIQLIVYLLAGNANYEPDFKSGFEAKRSQTKQWSLTVSSVQQRDEAVYLCAASHTVQQHSWRL